MDKKILLIGPDAQPANLLLSAFHEAGILAVHVEDEVQALIRRAEEIPDVIVICQGPGLDPVALTRELRAEAVIPIVLLFEAADEAGLLQGYAAGADDCLSGPVSAPLVVAKVRVWLRRARMMPFNALVPLSSHGLILDPSARAVLLSDGRQVRLTNLEFRLLYCLMAHQGQPISTETLLDRVWGYEGGDGALLKRLIYRLRQKIEPDPANPRYISTSPRLGYTFEQE